MPAIKIQLESYVEAAKIAAIRDGAQSVPEWLSEEIESYLQALAEEDSGNVPE